MNWSISIMETLKIVYQYQWKWGILGRISQDLSKNRKKCESKKRKEESSFYVLLDRLKGQVSFLPPAFFTS